MRVGLGRGEGAKAGGWKPWDRAHLWLRPPSAHSCPHDGRAESLHQDQPSSGSGAALSGCSHRRHPPVVPGCGVAGPVCLAKEAAERERP